MDIVILSLIRHDAPISSTTLALAKVLCKNHRVFYIDHPRTMKDVRAEEGIGGLLKHHKLFKKKTISPMRVDVGSSSFLAFRPWMTWPVNFLPAGSTYDGLSRWNDSRMNSFLSTLLKEYGMKDYIFINAMDPFFYLNIPDSIKPKKHFYYSLDNISEVDYTAKHGSRLEEEQVKSAEAVLATSTVLKSKMEQWRQEVTLLPNAVDFDHFHSATSDSTEVASELQGLEMPLIGYVGSLEYRVDADIMEKILQQNPDKKLVVIGPVIKEHFPMERLEGYENLMYLGPRKFEELPSYLKAFACGIIPFKNTGVTKSIYPLKVNEYLAAGLPVVATQFSPDIESFKDDIHLADNPESFAQKVGEACNQKYDEKRDSRFQTAKANTWSVRVKKLEELF